MIGCASNKEYDKDVWFSLPICLVYSEIMRAIHELDGFKTGGKVVNNLRYADDTVILTE